MAALAVRVSSASHVPWYISEGQQALRAKPVSLRATRQQPHMARTAPAVQVGLQTIVPLLPVPVPGPGPQAL
jgi:hypothetical protein